MKFYQNNTKDKRTRCTKKSLYDKIKTKLFMKHKTNATQFSLFSKLKFYQKNTKDKRTRCTKKCPYIEKKNWSNEPTQCNLVYMLKKEILLKKDKK